MISFLRDASVNAQTASPQGVFWKPDGLRMYLAAANDLEEYSASEAWNVTTIAHVRTLSLLGGLATGARDVFFSPAGTKMFVTGDDFNRIVEFSLTTGWDISTASEGGNLVTDGGTPQGSFIRADGLKLFVVNQHLGNGVVEEYSLPAPYSVPTGSFIRRVSVDLQEGIPKGISFKTNGTVMRIIGQNATTVFSYALSTAWDLLTLMLEDSFLVTAQDASMSGLFFGFGNSKLYLTGVGTTPFGVVYEYDVPVIPDILAVGDGQARFVNPNTVEAIPAPGNYLVSIECV